MRKRYYCSKCKCYPDTIVIQRSLPLVERVDWNGEFYRLVFTNESKILIVKLCDNCKTELIEK